ncbi:primosomal protein N' [Geosporobacter ferrireducens]|uniref:Replication restart protein PriA n=1 Tax=Geosporobacter ferrireducens TaxID=1424294 RepID=A0A1D8GBX3_9FIRM|nr:primosomal protein N' [Geosporobacter ferrireducens]AOT68418.1 primosomal protein N' [Geosporobacter ferrireducens]MTI53873.1 primosomal protein N' [Geosporobacter ferrireducens]
MKQGHFAEIYINQKSNHTDRAFTYQISADLVERIHVGSRVMVPFGRGNNLIEGYVVQLRSYAEIDQAHIKTVQAVVEEEYALNQELIDLAQWMKEQYLCRFIDAVQCILPTGSTLKRERVYSLARELNIHTAIESVTEKQQAILRLLDQYGSMNESQLQSKLEGAVKELNKLLRKKMIRVEELFKKDVNTIKEKMIRLPENKSYEEILGCIAKTAVKQKSILAYLMQNGPTSWPILKKAVGVSTAILKGLEEKGLVNVLEIEKRRNPYKNLQVASNQPYKLTNEQEQAMETIMPFLNHKQNRMFLLHGITGSGKTEIYLQLIEILMKQDRDAILLVPEISLTTQMIERFHARFGDQIAVLHSRLSLGERFDEWKRIYNGEVKIAIGARSAVFAPFRNLGMIIIDEEHEHSYKSDYSPKYHAVEVAEVRCRANNALLILGSATPSVESYNKSITGEYQLIQMVSRYNFNPLPKVSVIDMREELQRGNKSIFSEMLYNEIRENLKRKEQTILFLNRRGYSTFISCRKCGFVVKCPQCEIALTYHKNIHHLTCHYCGQTQKPPTTCLSCGSKYIKYFGVGTEQIEKVAKDYFPSAVVARLDLDTTTRKGSMERILKDYSAGRIDLLIGTQMIAKGLDFPNVTLVGIIAADTSLNLPDFRASEKTFQLITQVSGRAGRGERPGRVVVQTYEPNHFAIRHATNSNYLSFYEQEIKLRREFFYPPFSSLINIIFSGDDEGEVIRAAQEYTGSLKNYLHKEGIDPAQTVYGPAPAHLAKIRQNFRWQLIIKSKSVDQSRLTGIINSIRMENKMQDIMRRIIISIDINPYSML